jgi:hypothetical protein
VGKLLLDELEVRERAAELVAGAGPLGGLVANLRALTCRRLQRAAAVVEQESDARFGLLVSRFLRDADVVEWMRACQVPRMPRLDRFFW